MKLATIIFILLLTGCESSQDMFKTHGAEGEVVDSGVRCEMMARTGSNRKTKVCRTTEQIMKDQSDAEKSMERMQKTGMTLNK